MAGLISRNSETYSPFLSVLKLNTSTTLAASQTLPE